MFSRALELTEWNYSYSYNYRIIVTAVIIPTIIACWFWSYNCGGWALNSTLQLEVLKVHWVLRVNANQVNDTNTKHPQIVTDKNNRWRVILDNLTLITDSIKYYNLRNYVKKHVSRLSRYLWKLSRRPLDATMIVTQITKILPQGVI